MSIAPEPRPAARRPLATRQTGLAKALARRIARSAVTPNRISQASVLAALIAGLCFGLAGTASGAAATALLLGAAVFIQLRLLCNMLDGMVAVEGGKATRDGQFWNEVPDRVSDMLILVGAGWGAGAPALGWAAAAFAVLTAYLRAFGAAMGMAEDFRGPMAKQHRMALLSVAAVASCVAPHLGVHASILEGALWVIALGTVLTCLRRAARLRRRAGAPLDPPDREGRHA